MPQTVERGFELSIAGNRIVANVANDDTASVALRLSYSSSTNETDGLVMDFYSSPDGVTLAAGKGALATLAGANGTEELMSTDFSTKGYPFIIGVVSTVTTDAGTRADVWITSKRNTA